MFGLYYQHFLLAEKFSNALNLVLIVLESKFCLCNSINSLISLGLIKTIRPDGYVFRLHRSAVLAVPASMHIKIIMGFDFECFHLHLPLRVRYSSSMASVCFSKFDAASGSSAGQMLPF